MADDSRNSVSNIGTNGFIWLLALAAGTFFVTNRLPLEGSRPPTIERVLPERHGVQDVDARLWQDPFVAVAERSSELDSKKCPGQEEAVKGAPGQDEELVDHCQSQLNGISTSPLLVLVASVSGAPYSEEQEVRRRTRYAILAGLNAEGFVPADSQHIGFYWPDAAARLQSAKLTVKLPKVVPFEWFDLDLKSAAQPKRILLLWFDEDVLHAERAASKPLRHFHEFLYPLNLIRHRAVIA
jgi:hypothetical protein